MKGITANNAVTANHTPGALSSKLGAALFSQAVPDRTGIVCPGALRLLK